MASVDQVKLQAIFLGPDRGLLNEMGRIIRPHTPALINVFYSELLGHPEVGLFLENESVVHRLTSALNTWMSTLFDPATPEDVDAFITAQRRIGENHARINVPMHHVVEGMRLIRREISNYMTESEMDRGHLAKSLLLLNELLDHVLSLMNESYMSGAIAHDRNIQSLKMQVPPHALAMEAERLRSALFDWQRRAVTTLHRRFDAEASEWETLEQSEFGLWAKHKAPLLFRDTQEAQQLDEQVRRLDQLLQLAGRHKMENDEEDFAETLHEMSDLVTETAWMISTLIDQTLEMEAGRDALTRLFNRRFLPTIFKHEISISMKHESPFAVLLLDIDFFKKINDAYGHDAGDQVLREFAERLAVSVRASDYVFRYGGEEFLIILGDVDVDSALRGGEKIRTAIAETPFTLQDGRTLEVTTSVGISVHGGHPDFQRVINRADEALYQAKEQGRNRSIVAGTANVMSMAAS